MDFHYEYLWRTTQSAFISLRETGKLELISNDELRSELIEYFDNYEHYFQRMTEYHSRGKRRLVEALERDLEIIPHPDYRRTRGYSTVLRVPPEDFPTHPDVLTALINLDLSAAERRGLVDKGVVKVTNLREAILKHLEMI